VSPMSCGDTGEVRRSPRVLVLLLTFCLAAVAGCTGGSDAVDQTAGGEFRFVAGTGKGQVIPEQDRKSAPEVSGQLLDGGDWSLAAQRGKVVVLNFWGSWCPPCRVETPDFDQAYKAVRGDGVEFVGVAVKDRKEAAAAFLQDKKISYPSLFDPAGKVTLRFRDLRTNGFPYTIVIDRKGRVAAVYPTVLLQEDIQPVATRLAAEG
jgi:thiol-disulfide isomerase/thioredoxin